MPHRLEAIPSLLEGTEVRIIYTDAVGQPHEGIFSTTQVFPDRGLDLAMKMRSVLEDLMQDTGATLLSVGLVSSEFSSVPVESHFVGLNG
jgi:hypothetical protein